MAKNSGRRVGDGSSLRPVKKIELSDKNIKRRIFFVALFFVISLVAFGYGINGLLTTNSGWTEIEVSTSVLSCGDDFTFNYKLGCTDQSATAEKRALIAEYTELCVNAYNEFCNDGEIEGVNNIYYINEHPNQEIEVSEVLYQAFALLDQYDNRNIFLAPVYETYDDMFACQDQSQAVEYDPYRNDEIKEYYQEICTYAGDEGMISIELLGDNKIRLNVSEDYLAFAEENYITSYIDFFWMKNAFITDYIADQLELENYTHGTLSSFDGFTRTLSEFTDGTSSDDQAQAILNPDTYTIYSKLDSSIYASAAFYKTDSAAIVSLRDFILEDSDSRFYYSYDGIEVRNSYISTETGMCQNSVDELTSYSTDKSCAEILMNLIPIYISDSLEDGAVAELENSGIHSLYGLDNFIYYTDQDIDFSYVYDEEDATFKIEQLN